MSSKANHIKRSHRSEFRERPYHTGLRQAIGTPTVSKRSFMQFIKMIRGAMRRQPKTTKEAEA
jgi:hypothetical protein